MRNQRTIRCRLRQALLALSVLGSMLVLASMVHAQIFPIPPTPREYFENAPLTTEPTLAALFEPPGGYVDDSFRFWAQASYVAGWVKQDPLPIPLVTTGNAKDKRPGAINQPRTALLFGNSGIGFRIMSGARITVGTWIGAEKVFGIEGSGFVLARGLNHQPNASDSGGSPLLAVPFFNETKGSVGEDARVLANPGKSVGDVLVSSSLQTWGTEINGLWNVWRSPGVEVSLMGGFRYADLQEKLEILTHSIAVARPPTPNTGTTTDDIFQTRNQFYGGQLGVRLHAQRDVVSLDITPTMAWGATHQVVEVQGDSSQFGPKGVKSGSFPGGFFAQPSNIGRATMEQSTILPSLSAKVGYQITPHLRAFAGYDVLYWNQVVRPGDQIDRDINLSQSTLFGKSNGVLSGTAAPNPRFTRSYFWNQDVTVGFELRY